ncbi:cytochrome c1 [Aquincola sp. S2]|uniref:Cytochrome c1 n=1 Tax=Pseudaquabacterium terrae TaxID=2732868 RepID=A0ABX2EKH7_9BURK|nr:cytochrome c1 [Aquabacterium terrae]NRF69104.1 cytochrome c1 [Aquabacterium terrae]
MKRILACLLVLVGFAGLSHASESTVPLDRFQKERVTDMAALQHGAKLFVNYCLNCHAAAFMRYNRLRDIGLGDEQIKKNLLFATEKVGDLMTVSLDPKHAKEWFGAVPPDLSVVARSRASAGGSGADYLYTYLRSFYRDETRPTGWNNTVFPAVGMPHALWELQGEQRAIFTEEKDAHDPTKTQHVFKGFEISKPGKMTKAEYDLAMADLTAYMVWMAEPVQNERVRLGVWVLLFLAVFTLIAWRLNAAYWKDIK